MSNRTLAEVRAECIALGIQPGRSIAECERRIAERRASQAEAAADKARIEGEFAKIGAWPQGVQAITAPVKDSAPPLTEKTRQREAAKREVRVSPALAAPYYGSRKFTEFAKAAVAEVPDNNLTPEEEQAMAEYSAEMRRMDAMGEAAWMAEQFKPRMSRTMRMLCDTTAICGTLARNPLVYGGDLLRHDYTITGAWQQALMMQGRAMARSLVVRRR